MKRSWDGLRLYDHPIDPYQQYANAYVAAALPAYAHKGRAAKAAEVAWKACPETGRAQYVTPSYRDLTCRVAGRILLRKFQITI